MELEKFALDTPSTPRWQYLPLTIAKLATIVTVSDNLSSAVNITLQQTTALIEVTSKFWWVYLRYTSDASASNFDEYIWEWQTRHYAIPKLVTVISVIQDDSWAWVRIIEKSTNIT